jgi:hypothetical protein
MGFGSKPKADPEMKRMQAEAKAREAREKASQEDLSRRQRAGRRSLLGTEGDELGVI